VGVLNSIKKHLSAYLSVIKETEPEEAYNLWADQYDGQEGNLMLDLDEALFSELINKIPLQNKIIIDVGCGTGRHWEKLYANHPAQIIGYDVSEGMLKVLKTKFPQAEIHKSVSTRLQGLENNSCDLLICTLALAHIENIDEAFAEWNRVLKANGHIIITDYHPDALAKGGDRTFMHNGKRVAIKNYVHPIFKIETAALKLNFRIEELREKKIDATVRHYYEKQDALRVFEKFNGTAILYGLLLRKTDAIK
jgi:ubiquinone/menaquinone biosynthesis C-methylase UbiE